MQQPHKFVSMITEVTAGIKVSVETQYLPEQSRPLLSQYFFAYHISIENQSEYTIQLMRRHWHIFDSNGQYREVEGDGVVGLQPILEPGAVHEYTSGCNLQTDMGKMHGTYQMLRMVDQEYIDVKIPQFDLIAPIRMN